MTPTSPPSLVNLYQTISRYCTETILTLKDQQTNRRTHISKAICLLFVVGGIKNIEEVGGGSLLMFFNIKTLFTDTISEK
jgi:hypothetical protein